MESEKQHEIIEIKKIRSQAIRRLLEIYSKLATQDLNLNELAKMIRQTRKISKPTSYDYAHAIQIIKQINGYHMKTSWNKQIKQLEKALKKNYLLAEKAMEAFKCFIDVICTVLEMSTCNEKTKKNRIFRQKMTFLNQKLKETKNMAEQCKICENCQLPTLNPQSWYGHTFCPKCYGKALKEPKKYKQKYPPIIQTK
ncbi:MAG TPA: hypothetical protein ENG10_01735 [Candidatus Bathyarchaeota archaeon]|nr:hypothetical protein [Candidatus Bathyarchaeota archaeon]HEX69002.1 hypothetical protein [Candidatus Bathyarchaeota archaeon]